MFSVRILLHCVAITAIHAVQLGVITNSSLILSNPSVPVTRTTCDECLCAMFNSTGNGSILALNCHTNTANSVTCEMFTLETYLTSSNFGMVSNASSSFFFRQLPSVNISETTSVTAGNGVCRISELRIKNPTSLVCDHCSRLLLTLSSMPLFIPSPLISETTMVSTYPSPIDVGNASTLWTTTVADSTVYTCRSFSWTGSKNGSVSFVMRLRNDPSKWFVDDISILRGATEMLVNGDFETGSLSPWVVSHPNGTCGSWGAAVTNSVGVARTGNYGLWDGSTGCFDQVDQSFNVTLGQQYEVSFWVKSRNVSSTGIYANFSIG